MRVSILLKTNGWCEVTFKDTGIVLEFDNQEVMNATLIEILKGVGLPH